MSDASRVRRTRVAGRARTRSRIFAAALTGLPPSPKGAIEFLGLRKQATGLSDHAHARGGAHEVGCQLFPQ